MPDLNTLLDGLSEKPTILFFASFARFEYALMQRGLLTRAVGRAEADWRKLADELGKDFFLEVRERAAVQTLIHAPPRKLIVVNGAAAFGPPLPPVTNLWNLSTRQDECVTIYSTETKCSRPIGSATTS